MQEKNQIIVKGQKVDVLKIEGEEYISLTDLARYADKEEPRLPIRDWMRNKDVILYLGLWENINNKNFNRGEFAPFKNEAGSNTFKMSPQKWIEKTNAVGIISKSGRYGGGTYAHPDIAFEFASWLSPEFKLYLITEFQRLKKKESKEKQSEWNASRFLAKINYSLQTESIKENIIPTLTEKQKKYIYQNEADIINVSLFGMTAKEWKENNPNIEGNIRDNTDLLHLIVLSNLESINAELINMNISQEDRLVLLNEIAKNQILIISKNKNLTYNK